MTIASMVIESPLVKEIRVFAGLIADIPSGWSLCDGQNGRPDLRNTFIKGVGSSENPGGTGGNTSHDHAAHDNHQVTQPNAHDSHTHSPGTLATNTITGTRKGGTSGAATLTDSHTHAVTTGVTGNESASLAHSGAAVDSHSAHDSVNHEPVYYKLAFITKSVWWT